MAPAFEVIGTALAVNFTVNTLILAVVLACLSALHSMPATRFLALAASVTLGGYALDIALLSPYWRSTPWIFVTDPGEVYLQMALAHPHKALYMAALGLALCTFDYLLTRLVFRFGQRSALACSLGIGLLTNPFYLLP